MMKMRALEVPAVRRARVAAVDSPAHHTPVQVQATPAVEVRVDALRPVAVEAAPREPTAAEVATARAAVMQPTAATRAAAARVPTLATG